VIQMETNPVVSACLGGGGFFAIAFNMGVVHGLQDAGLPIGEGLLLGTSGGAWAAGALALAVPMEEVVDATVRGKVSGVAHHEITRHVFGDSRDRRVRTTAIDRRTGQQRILHAEQLGVADVVGASSAAPGLFPPYPIGSRRYVDGGLYSPTSAHHAAPADVLVVVAPMAGPRLRPMGPMYARMAKNEARLWRIRTRRRGRTLYIEPTSAVAAVAGRGWRGLIDHRSTSAVYREARELGVRRGRHFLTLCGPEGTAAGG
jgi:predicted acylesterase/phospholipase RssA